LNNDVRHIHTSFYDELNVASTECAKRQGDAAEAQENTDDVASVETSYFRQFAKLAAKQQT